MGININSDWLHSGSIGDCWAAMPAMKEYYKKTGKKINLYLENGVKAFYYDGATHPTLDKTGEQVMLNERVINMMIPLFKAQEYIEDCKIYSNQPIQINLNRIRETFVNMPYHSLSMWYSIIFPDLTCDLSKQYIFVPDSERDIAKDKIIVTRTERYTNQKINYSFLKKYENDLIFSGTELERIIFNARFGLNIQPIEISNFLELAQAIKQAKFLLSNQTQIFQIAEGLKTPRIVELCSFAPNVEPIGEDACYFYAQEALEFHVKYLSGEIQKTQTNGLPAIY